MKRCLAMALLLAASTAQAEPSCSLRRVASATMQITDAGKLVIDGAIGTVPVKFRVDTRLVRSVMFQGAVSRFGLAFQTVPEQPLDIDDRPLDGLASVPSMSIGDFAFSSGKFAVSRLTGDGTNGTEAGVIGADLLRYLDVEIDPAGGKFNLYSQDHCDGKVVYWAKEYNRSDVHVLDDGEVEIDTELDGQRLHALLATGLATSVLGMRAAVAHFGIDQATSGLQAADAIPDLSGSALPAYRYAFKSFKFGDLTIGNPRIELAPIWTPWHNTGSHITSDLSPDLLIGMSFLRRLHLYIAYREDRIYYTPI